MLFSTLRNAGGRRFAGFLLPLLLFASGCADAGSTRAGKIGPARPSPSARQPSKPSAVRSVSLTILHTNDVHGQLFPFDAAGAKNVGGAARRSTLIKKLKAADPELLVLDAGDIWQRGPLEKWNGEPDIRVMNAIGYELSVVGNNEVRAGIPNLLLRGKQARFPILCANVRLKSTGELIGRESVVWNRKGLRIGIFGVTAPRIAAYEGMEVASVEDPIQAARRVAERLRPNVDLLIALTHIAFPLDRVLAEEVPEIDVIVGGDSHTRLDRPYEVRPAKREAKVIPIVQAGDNGRWVGRLDLVVTPGRSPGPVERFSGRLIPVTAAITPDPKITAILNSYLNKKAPAPSTNVSSGGQAR